MLKRLRSTAVAAAVASIALVASGCAGGGGDKGTDIVTIATGGSSGVYYQVGAGYANLLKDSLGSDATVQATGASVENVTLVHDGNAEIAFTQADAVDQAIKGEGPFEDKSADNIQAIGALYDQYIQVVTTEKSGIKTFDDLKGKKISVGDANSGVELNARAVVKAYGYTYDDFNVDYLSYADAIDAMKNGQLDAAFFTSGIPNSAVSDLATTEKVVVLPLDGEGAKTLLDEYDYLGEATVPADTYKSAEDAKTLTIPNLLIASPDLTEEAGYEMTKVFYDNLDKLEKSHSSVADIDIDKAADVKVAELHPGAKKYFEEKGLL
ncbi:TAXI family TRAP transporter solute-binding subunit [Brevibacterium sp. HMSC063G07]|uniref:TAXI family TRAP transporter solute-binding subunit n=1 Tax=Brevibacterium sp. HMSC063G07 TaxID=1739261 RepID=UPI0008A5912C|nr:TAXI family TRAP transporter solute-binding subunit [Brevibacterium sp. HMSC063G07]OFL67847.1 hypothetical protein HMPREF2757_09240 [Brevibacterium sp. HMSC063G07]